MWYRYDIESNRLDPKFGSVQTIVLGARVCDPGTTSRRGGTPLISYF